jgi:hypothetical protein
MYSGFIFPIHKTVKYHQSSLSQYQLGEKCDEKIYLTGKSKETPENDAGSVHQRNQYSVS